MEQILVNTVSNSTIEKDQKQLTSTFETERHQGGEDDKLVEERRVLLENDQGYIQLCQKQTDLLIDIQSIQTKLSVQRAKKQEKTTSIHQVLLARLEALIKTLETQHQEKIESLELLKKQIADYQPQS